MLIELLRRAAAGEAKRPVVITAEGSEAYGECLERAEAFARGLSDRGVARFGSAVQSPADIVPLLAGASAVGSEACLYPRDLDDDALARLALRFEHDVIVTDSRRDLETAESLPLSELASRPGPPANSAEASPVLILTTGTTGDQKGARHDWRRLARAVRRPDPEPGTRWLLAYNLNQFAGVQILLHVLASWATLVVPASRRAEDVIDAIRTHAVTHVSATPTFWRLLVGRLDAGTATELPLTQITLGGEAAPESLLAKLRTLFPSARISHVYAGTEFGSAVSVRDGRSGLPLSVLERDENADIQLRIVDGELQIRSRVGMIGYHEREDDDDEWRPTGDLVEVRGDRIHFVGRTTEIINVGGAKVHPLPVEDLICSVEGVHLAAVYGRPNAVTGQIVAADVVPAPGVDAIELEQRIRAECQKLPAAGRPRRIRFVPELDVRGNKLLRRHEANVTA